MTESQKNNVTKWGQLILYVGGLIVAIALSFGSVQGRIQVLEVETKAVKERVEKLEIALEKINQVSVDVREVKTKLELLMQKKLF